MCGVLGLAMPLSVGVSPLAPIVSVLLSILPTLLTPLAPRPSLALSFLPVTPLPLLSLLTALALLLLSMILATAPAAFASRPLAVTQSTAARLAPLLSVMSSR
jgi:hypothetical protein